MNKFEEELMATAKMIPTSDGNEIKFKTSSALYDYLLLSNGEAELYLESQLQQQALPVVPDFVDKWYKFHMIGTFSAVMTAYAFDGADKPVIWLVQNGGMDLLCKMKLYGYTVEKPQLFRLKLNNATISNYYLWLNQATGKVFVDKKFLDWTNHDNVKNIFTEQEIAKISDGAFVNNEAFELVPVEDGE